MQDSPVIVIRTVAVPVCGGMPVSMAPIRMLYSAMVSRSNFMAVEM